MSSEPIRDPVTDHLLTPQNAAFIVIDYQPVQVNSIASMERQRLVSNILRASKAAVIYGLPIVHSTVNVQTGINKPPIAPLRKLLDKVPVFDRTTINAWEEDRKSTRLNSSHSQISYAVFCLKKKKSKNNIAHSH